MSTWSPFKLAIDAALMGGLVTPGLVLIEHLRTPRHYDERNGYGWSGSFPVFTGQRLGSFDITFRMYNDADWALYQNLRPLLVRPPYGKRPKAIDVVHPILLDSEITSCVIADVHGLEMPEPGVWHKTIECLQWRVPKLALAKPEGSDQTPPEDDPYAKLLDSLANQVKSEAAAQGLKL